MHKGQANMSTPYHLNWGAEALWQQLTPLLPELSVEVVARLGSTNTELLERMRRRPDARVAEPTSTDRKSSGRRQADTQPCLLVAEHQTRGRGRQGKEWQASLGASLTFSLALPLAPADWSGLSLAVGLAVAETFDPQPPGGTPRLGIKWPNDLLLIDPATPGSAAPLGRKLGGILIETVQVGDRRMAVVGIGLNLLPLADDDADRPLSWGYACLQELQYGLTAPAALAKLALPLVQMLQTFEREGFAPLQARFAARDVLRGHAVTTTLPGLPVGTADGVDDTGTLWLRVAGQRRPVSSGEVSLRPAPDAGGAATC
jgi:BirA family transcriptional regulator, biotin operon repressor / biotin---[acetyl-CoA-carboxylase] ligase